MSSVDPSTQTVREQSNQRCKQSADAGDQFTDCKPYGLRQKRMAPRRFADLCKGDEEEQPAAKSTAVRGSSGNKRRKIRAPKPQQHQCLSDHTGPSADPLEGPHHPKAAAASADNTASIVSSHLRLAKRGKAARSASRNPNNKCTQCETNSTTLWRAGPAGPHTLCNACGIRFRRSEAARLNSGSDAANAAAQLQVADTSAQPAVDAGGLPAKPAVRQCASHYARCNNHADQAGISEESACSTASPELSTTVSTSRRSGRRVANARLKAGQTLSADASCQVMQHSRTQRPVMQKRKRAAESDSEDSVDLTTGTKRGASSASVAAAAAAAAAAAGAYDADCAAANKAEQDGVRAEALTLFAAVPPGGHSPPAVLRKSQRVGDRRALKKKALAAEQAEVAEAAETLLRMAAAGACWVERLATIGKP